MFETDEDIEQVAQIIWNAGLFGIDLSYVDDGSVHHLAEEIVTYMRSH